MGQFACVAVMGYLLVRPLKGNECEALMVMVFGTLMAQGLSMAVV